MKKRNLTTNDIKEKVRLFSDNKFELISEYNGPKNNITIKGLECGHVFDILPSNFFREKRKKCLCTICNKEKTLENLRPLYEKINKEEFIKEFNLIPDLKEYSIISDFISLDKKIKVKHNICGRKYSVRASSILRDGRRCPYCMKTIGPSKNEIERILNDKFGNKISILTNFNKVSDKVLIRCNLCQNQRSDIISNLLNHKYSCSCERKEKEMQKRTNIIKERLGENFELISTDIPNLKSDIIVKHLKCGNIFTTNANNIISSKYCPICSASKGEARILDYLLKKRISYIYQYKFSDCKYKSELIFDFVIKDKNNNIFAIIEYDGEQHFTPYRYGNKSSKKFEDTKIRDNIKNEYCKANNYNLLRISYKDYKKIDSILDDIFKDY